jgi:CubicO group peptidase (beta-lactamase class C family)
MVSCSAGDAVPVAKRICAIWGLVCCLLPGAYRPAEEPMTARMDAIFRAVVGANTPGAAVLVRHRGQTVFERGYGVRDLHSLTPIDAQTNFRLASATKQFTAMAIMLLVHDRKLRYEDKLTDVLPDPFPSYGRTITVRNLLNHTSGLPDYEELMDKFHPSHWNEQHQIQDADVVELLGKTQDTKFAPGTKWAYSNSGYVLLGWIAAQVSGKPFGEILRQRIFGPLKMDQTLAYEKGKNEVANRAYGHTKAGNTWKQTDQSATSATLGDGGVYSSLGDLAKWDQALTNHTLLSENEMRAAITPAKLIGGGEPVWPAGQDRREGSPAWYGFGWFLDPYRGHQRMWHYGETMGFHSLIARFPADELSIVVLSNRTDLNLEALADEIADLFLRLP